MTRRMNLTKEQFVERYGGIYEHSPWVAEQCYPQVDDAKNLADVFAACVDAAEYDARLMLIRAHPDLAGRAAVAGELTVESTSEQASAGIAQCTPEEFDRFVSFNDRYKKKFGFPFVMAVRNSNRHEILAAFEHRIENDEADEFATAMFEIHKIARLRLEALSAHEQHRK